MAGAAILWEAAGEAEVRAALASLPISVAGMLEIVAVVPLEPYPGFGLDSIPGINAGLCRGHTDR